MAIFRINVPVESADPRVAVESRLNEGFHRFQLVAVGRNGQQSAPDFALVQVLPQRPIG
jgi:hypothetical protein